VSTAWPNLAFALIGLTTCTAILTGCTSSNVPPRVPASGTFLAQALDAKTLDPSAVAACTLQDLGLPLVAAVTETPEHILGLAESVDLDPGLGESLPRSPDPVAVCMYSATESEGTTVGFDFLVTWSSADGDITSVITRW